MTNGYNFYFKYGSDVLTFPITPAQLSIKVGSNNKVITLINEGDINILKSPSLIEVEFEARFPMRKYPYSRDVSNFETYFKVFEELKEKKKSFRFIVARTNPNGKRTWDTNLLVALEDFSLNEDADEGDDVLIEFKLKQYKEYGVKKLSDSELKKLIPEEETPPKEPTRPNDNKGDTSVVYVVKSGDCLWNIAKAAYGDGSKYTVIYEANKTVIEDTARKYRNGKGSSNGHWIYPGTKLVIPDAKTADLTVQKLKNNKNNKNNKGNNQSNNTPTTKQNNVKIGVINPNSEWAGSITVSFYSHGILVTGDVLNTGRTVLADATKPVTVKVKTKYDNIGETYVAGWQKSYDKSTKTYIYRVNSVPSAKELILRWKAASTTHISSSGIEHGGTGGSF